MTLAEWGNPTALFSYRLKRLSTVEIRAGCRFWVTPAGRGATRERKKPPSPPGTPESGSSAEKTLESRPRPFYCTKNNGYAGMPFSVGRPILPASSRGLAWRKLLCFGRTRQRRGR